VTGDAVNVAARLEQIAEPGEILVGERTAAAAQGAFEFGPPTTVRPRAKPTASAAEGSCERSRSYVHEVLPGSGRAFVGRERELQLLQATYRRAVEGREPHLVTIAGKRASVRRGWSTHSGSCSRASRPNRSGMPAAASPTAAE